MQRETPSRSKQQCPQSSTWGNNEFVLFIVLVIILILVTILLKRHHDEGTSQSKVFKLCVFLEFLELVHAHHSRELRDSQAGRHNGGAVAKS